MANFMDFNVQLEEKRSLAKALTQAAKLGYDVVAVNHIAPSLGSTLNKNKKAKDHHVIPEHGTLKLDDTAFQSITAIKRKFRQLSRFSVVMEDSSQLQKINQPLIQAYDLVAVQPLSEKVLTVAVSSMKIDIVIIDVTQKLPFPIKRPLINVALERGIYFEIQYSPAIRDSASRKYMIANAQTLIRVCKGKNVIVSSGCQKAMDLRGPHDVANLCLLFGMTQEQAKAAITTNCQSLLLHAESRKITKSTIGVVHKSQVEEKDKWILNQANQCSNDNGCKKMDNLSISRTSASDMKQEVKSEIDQESVAVKRKLENGHPQETVPKKIKSDSLPINVKAEVIK